LLLALAVCCLLPAVCFAEQPIPFADGVIDAELRIAFVSSPKGGVQAIRLDDGKVLWTNDARSVFR
jgi:hypothetical protein